VRARFLLAACFAFTAACGGKVLDGECTRVGTGWTCTSGGAAAGSTTGGDTAADAGGASRTLSECLWANVAAGTPCHGNRECFTCSNGTGTDWVCPSWSPGQTPQWQAVGSYSCSP
jgi:hypothetical protein